MARGEVRYRLTAETKDFERPLEAARKQLVDLGNSFMRTFGPATAALAGFSAGAAAIGVAVKAIASPLIDVSKAAIDLGGRLADLNAKTGISAEGLQKLQAAGRLTGVELGSITGAVGQMNKRLVEAPAGFEKLGLSVERLKASRPDQALAEIGQRLAALRTPAEQAAAGAAVFGKAYQDILPLLKSDIKAVGEEMQRLGVLLDSGSVRSLDQLGDRIDVAAMAWEGFQNQLGAAIASSPVFAQAVNDVIEVLGDMNNWVIQNREGIHNLISAIDGFARSAVTGFRNAYQAIEPFAKRLMQIADFTIPGFQGSRGAIGDFLGSMRSSTPGLSSSSRLVPPPGGPTYTSTAADAEAKRAREEWERSVATYRAAHTALGLAEQNIRKVNVALAAMGSISNISSQEMIGHVRTFQAFGEEGVAVAQMIREEWERTHGVFLLFGRTLPNLRPPGAGETGQRGPSQPLTPAPFHFDPNAAETPEERRRREDAFAERTRLIQAMGEAITELGAALFSADSLGARLANTLGNIANNVARARQRDFIGAGVGALTGAMETGRATGAAGGSSGQAAGLGALQGGAAGAQIGMMLGGPVGAAIGGGIGAIGGALSGLLGHARGAAAALKEMNRELKDSQNLLEDIREAGNAAAASMKAMSAGMEIEGLDDFINEMVDKVISGTVGLLENLRPTTEAEARALGAIFNQAFWAVVRERGLIAASDAFREAFHNLMESFRALGITADGPLANVGRLLDLGADPEFRRLAEAANFAAEALEGLGGMEFVLPDTLAGTAELIMSLFQRMMAESGGDFEASFTAIMRLLAEYVDQAQRSGTPIDPRIAALLQRANEEGIRPLTSVAEHQLQTLRDILAAIHGIDRGARGGVPGTGAEGDQGQGSEGEGNVPKPRDRRGGFAGGAWIPAGGWQGGDVAEAGEGEAIVPASGAAAFAQGISAGMSASGAVAFMQQGGGSSGGFVGARVGVSVTSNPNVNINLNGPVDQNALAGISDTVVPEMVRAIRQNTRGLATEIDRRVDRVLRRRNLVQ